MENFELLKNKGMLVINGLDAPLVEKTVIVLAPPRSGTSMVAGALYHLGIYMGEDLSQVYEDIEFSNAVESENYGLIGSMIRERNDKFPVWGWKRPSSIWHIQNIEHMFRNPHYVVIFRDVFAVANRNRISMLSDVVDNMRQTLAHIERIVSFVANTRAPTLLVSYEKAMRDKESFVKQLAELAGVKHVGRITSAMEFVRDEPAKYLNESRITHSLGVLDSVSERKVMGWAAFKTTDIPAEVRLLINGSREFRTKAELDRQDLKDKGLHKTGRCGFMFNLPEGMEIHPGDRISVHVVGDTEDLVNSPAVYQNPVVYRRTEK